MEEKSLVSNHSSYNKMTIAVLIAQATIHLGMAVIAFLSAQPYNDSNPNSWDTFMGGLSMLSMIIFLLLGLPSLWLAFELWNNQQHRWFQATWASILLIGGIPYIPAFLSPYSPFALFGLSLIVPAVVLFISLYKTSSDGWLSGRPYPETGA